MDTIEAPKLTHSHIFDAAEMGALAHLYRGEVYRSTMWRTRLDHTTNWAVATLGIALSVTFSSREASPCRWCWWGASSSCSCSSRPAATAISTSGAPVLVG